MVAGKKEEERFLEMTRLTSKYDSLIYKKLIRVR
jgi:hypothetical protein